MGSKKRTRRRQYALLATGAAFAIAAIAVYVAGAQALSVVLGVWGFLVVTGGLAELSPRRTTRPAPAKPPRLRQGHPIFSDYPIPDLTQAEVKRAERAARRAAFRAQGSWGLTGRRLYGAYRGEVGDRFLDWPRWQTAYLSEYKKEGPLDLGSSDAGIGRAGDGYYP